MRNSCFLEIQTQIFKEASYLLLNNSGERERERERESKCSKTLAFEEFGCRVPENYLY